MERTERTRPKRKEVCFTEEEYKYVMKKVSLSNLDNFQTFALTMLIQGQVNFIDYKELFDLRSEVNRIGNNINQITKLANQFSEISNQDINELISIMKDIQLKIDKKFSDEIKSNNNSLSKNSEEI